MLFDARAQAGLADGSVDLAFRRWQAPRMKVGSQQRTRAGVVEVTELTVIEPADVTVTDAARAGFADLDRLWKAVDGRAGELYRIGLRVVGPDPRVALRDAAELSADDTAELERRLTRMDAAAEEPWTGTVLRLIAGQPGVRAPTLAERLGQPTQLFKRRVRRLKELGLTESLPVGYRLSPRGVAFLAAASPDRAGT